MNIVEQMSLLHGCGSFGYMPKSGIAGSCGRMIPIFLRNRHTEFVSSIYNSDYVTMESKQYRCLNKTHTMAAPVDMPAWIRELLQGPTLR